MINVKLFFEERSTGSADLTFCDKCGDSKKESSYL
jgi:hypothetical protein